MRRMLTTVTAIFVALAGTVAVAQKVTSPPELDATMKKISQAQGATAKAIQAGDFAAAKAPLDLPDRVRQSVSCDHEFTRQIHEGLDFRLADAERAIGRCFGRCLRCAVDGRCRGRAGEGRECLFKLRQQWSGVLLRQRQSAGAPDSIGQIQSPAVAQGIFRRAGSNIGSTFAVGENMALENPEVILDKFVDPLAEHPAQIVVRQDFVGN